MNKDKLKQYLETHNQGRFHSYSQFFFVILLVCFVSVPFYLKRHSQFRFLFLRRCKTGSFLYDPPKAVVDSTPNRKKNNQGSEEYTQLKTQFELSSLLDYT